MHEYSPAEFDANFIWRRTIAPYRKYLCKKYLPFTDLVITVCESIASKYKKEFGIECHVINNACPYVDYRPTSVLESNIKIVHHGIAIPAREIENMIYLTKLLDNRYALDLILMPYSKIYMVKSQISCKNSSPIHS